MNILIWILFGAAAGAIAGWLMKDKRGLLGDIVVGIIGSFFAGWAGTGFRSFQTTTISWIGFFTSILGAVVFIAILNYFKGKK